MKNLITILLLFFVLSINAQTNYDKTISVTIVEFSEACGEDPGDAIFCLTDEKGGKITERFSCEMDNQVWQVEPKDLITSEWVLNKKYKGKKATLYCVKSAGGAGWVVKKVEFGDASSAPKNQNASVANNQAQSFTGFISMSHEGMACNLVAKKEMDSPEVMTFALGNINVDSKKYFDGYCKLKPNYEAKKFTINYALQGTINVANKIKMVDEPPIVLEKDNFKTATCRAYDIQGKLIAIVDNNIIYGIKDGKKFENEGKAIQNKNELCIKGTQCVKVKVETDGCVSIFNLPNTTDKTSTLKIVGDKIYRTEKKGCVIDEYKEYYIFKGNKEQIALIAVLSRMGMGH